MCSNGISENLYTGPVECNILPETLLMDRSWKLYSALATLVMHPHFDFLHIVDCLFNYD